MKQYFSRFLAFLLGLFGIKKNDEVKAVAAPVKKLGLNEKRVWLPVARAFVSGNENFLVPAGEYVIRFEVDPQLKTPHYTFVEIDNHGQSIGASLEYWGTLFEKKVAFFI